jgi:hypothetical protein
MFLFRQKSLSPVAALIVAARSGRSTRTPSASIFPVVGWIALPSFTGPVAAWTVARLGAIRRRCALRLQENQKYRRSLHETGKARQAWGSEPTALGVRFWALRTFGMTRNAHSDQCATGFLNRLS